MGNLYCSIGEKSIIAELKINGQHSLHFYDNSFPSEEKLYHIFEDDLLQKHQEVDCICITAPHEPAYLLRTEDVPLFLEKNKNHLLFRNFSLDNSQSIVYRLPAYVAMLRSFSIPIYYYPTLEVLKEKVEDKKDFEGRKHFLFAFMMENMLHLLYYLDGENRVATIFECEASSDALYYSLLVLKEQNVNAEEVTFVASGRGSYFNEAQNLWKKYLSPYREYFESNEGQKYFDLKALMSCV